MHRNDDTIPTASGRPTVHITATRPLSKTVGLTGQEKQSGRGIAMRKPTTLFALFAAGSIAGAGSAQAQNAQGLNSVENIVVIFAENRSFDNLYGSFPGANGLQNATPESMTQLDRDGTEFKTLPP